MGKNNIARITAYVALVVVCFGCIGCATSGGEQSLGTNEQADTVNASTYEASIEYVDTSYLKDHLESSTIVDVRTPSEYTGTADINNMRAGHIPGAINISYAKLADESGNPLDEKDVEHFLQLKELSPSDPVVLYSGSDDRAEGAAKVLLVHGFTNVSLYEGGFDEWAADESNFVDRGTPACCEVG
ncbi:MAG: hypothetical protein IJ131_06085 [Eggerthellaceae bacterium]|nr:hypothetical protein [Eggerthellaceae bacterium]